MCALLGVSLLALIGPGLFAVRAENYQPFITHGAGGFLASLAPLFSLTRASSLWRRRRER